MDSKDAPDSTATAPDSSPLSLKSIAQQLFLDTLEPQDRIEIVAASLGQISPDDLTSIPLAAFQRGVAAHAAVPVTRALLKFLPQLEGRMKAVDNDEGLDGESRRTVYLIKTKEGDTRTLVVETSLHNSISENETSAEADFRYTTSPRKASFSYIYLSTFGSRVEATVAISNFKSLFTALAEDLQLPIVSSPELEAQEEKHALIQEEARARLRRDAEAATAAHGCKYGCDKCIIVENKLKIALDLIERPASKYTLPALQTPDAKQRDITFGRLLRALLPRAFRNEWMDNMWELAFIDCPGEGDDDIEDLLRRAAVDGHKVREEYRRC